MSGLVLVLGIPTEPPVAAVVRELCWLAAPHVVMDQRQLAGGSVTSWWSDGVAGGELIAGDTSVALHDVSAVYTRLTSWHELPEVGNDPDALARAFGIHQALEAWLETTTARVVNRTSANDSNNSKPYQSLLIRQHLEVPATLVTNDPVRAHEFWRQHERVIYKAISGERSIVTELKAEDADRLDLLASAPVQFQVKVDGVDVRVHVVGSEVFATQVKSDAVDYRYDPSGGGDMAAVTLPDAVADECVLLTRRLGLELSGLDLRFTDDGQVVCFEVNPSPAFSAYESVTGQPIAAAVARHLSVRLP
jgi:glutathione synthase/RimK-type ligase-like ATP-grasp enzyme